MIVLLSLACNLTVTPPTETPLPTPELIDSSPLLATATTARPTLLPLPDLPATAIPVTSMPTLGDLCDVYMTYSGARADNKLSLRSDPSTTAIQIVRVPNRVEVFRLPDSPEVEAEGYHWLNVIYVASPQMRYQGWIARDSFEVNGVRDPAVATLRPAGTQDSC
ncbi:MAG: hypothetical protein K8J31_14740 [Anaerolineae bacterium]|nr:hypothetical protein [Anaerolineae bacterium]